MAATDEPVSGKYACAIVRDITYDAQGEETASVAVPIGGDEILSWQYNHNVEDRTYASCRTTGKRVRVEGAEDLTGSIVVARRVDSPFRTQLEVGRSLTLWLFHRKPMVGVTGLYDQIPAKILSIEGGASIDEGGEQRYTVNFGLNEGWDGTATHGGTELKFDQEAAALPAP